MRVFSGLIKKKKKPAAGITRRDPDFFPRPARQQTPPYLWIACSDSTGPENEIADLLPGELLVHRNVANVVARTDLNCASVIQRAVEVLRARHIIACGHYGCGAVLAALRGRRLGLFDNRLRHVQAVREKHGVTLAALPSEAEQHDRLCELNFIEQVAHVCQTPVVQGAWARGQSLAVHGWIYSNGDGLLGNLGIGVTSAAEMAVIR